ncbi:hypothetical protein BKA62DRAFT_716701 [Auriculariales sp. MPI-PUGE-AT-0066]|nr:hypothetical protein BKA62DRAFT_716701 [Auriculariales sp. MPI-PUGE-AT-0066]
MGDLMTDAKPSATLVKAATGHQPRSDNDVVCLIAKAVYATSQDESACGEAKASGSRAAAGATKAATDIHSSLSPLVALSLVSWKCRRAALPYLMRSILIRGDWNECADAMLRLCLLKVLRHIRRFTLDVKLSSSTAQRHPSDGLPALLSRTLRDAYHLRHLGLDLPTYYTPLFGDALRRDTRLPEALRRVRSVSVGPYCEFAIHICQNVEQVQARGRWWLDTKANPAMRMFMAINSCLMLNALEMETDWTLPLVEAVRRAIPGLRYFKLLGDVPLTVVLPTLGQYKQLEVLVLSDLSSLNMPRDTKKVGASQKVAELCAGRSTTLVKVHIGRDEFDIVRSRHGRYIRVVQQASEQVW